MKTKRKEEVVSYDTQGPTRIEYGNLDQVYNEFNHKLFAGKLPPVIISLHRKTKALGYCWKDKYKKRGDNTKICEVALNPDSFPKRKDIEILSTLVHEMAHVWQFTFGKPTRGGYHNKEWAEKMKEVGLYPSTTALPGGKETGPQCSHYIITGGVFDKLAQEIIEKGFKFNWESIPQEAKAKKKDTSKTKFTCPECEQNAWAKDTANLECGDCNCRMEVEE